MAVGQDIGEIGELVQEAFKADGGLRRLLEVVLNLGMVEESAAHVGAGVHERTQERRGYRNGIKPRGLKTRVGELELQIPQVRNCEPYHPSFFARWERSERALLVACSEMYFQGVSTRNVQSVLREMCGTELSAMTDFGELSRAVSRVAGELDEQLDGFKARRLDYTPWEYLMLDARYEKVRVDGKVISQAALVVVGFTIEGKREVLDWRIGDSESEQHWGRLGFACLRSIRPPQGPRIARREVDRQRRAPGDSLGDPAALSGSGVATVSGPLQAGDGPQGVIQEAEGIESGPGGGVRSDGKVRVPASGRGDGVPMGACVSGGGFDVAGELGGLPDGVELPRASSQAAEEHEPAGEHHEAVEEANEGSGRVPQPPVMRPADRRPAAGTARGLADGAEGVLQYGMCRRVTGGGKRRSKRRMEFTESVLHF
jgi:hypothetical protein